MKYKDLIYKITSSNKSISKPSQTNTKNYIGILNGDKDNYSSFETSTIKTTIENKLTTILTSPIAHTFNFIPYSIHMLKTITTLLPEQKFTYLATRNEFNEAKKIKQENLNIVKIYPTLDKQKDFFEKIDYLVTINYKLNSVQEATIKEKKIMVFPLEFRPIENFSQKEKLVQPDPSGWSYNSATGIWTKNWGWDGKQDIQGW